MIDITEKVAQDPHYAVTPEDIKAYEARYGDIPDGAFVALRTDWSKRWPDMNALSDIAEDGSENFPGWSLDALRYIYEVRSAAAKGHEVLDTDASAEAANAGDLACERYVLAKGKLQIEVLCNLDQVPPPARCCSPYGRDLKARPACPPASGRLRSSPSARRTQTKGKTKRSFSSLGMAAGRAYAIPARRRTFLIW